MDVLAEAISNHRKAALLALAALAAFVALSAARCSALSEERAEQAAGVQAASQAEERDGQGGSESDAAGGGRAGRDAGDGGLAEMRARYGADEEEFVASLSAYVWQDSASDAVVEFGETRATVSEAGVATDSREYAVTALSGTPASGNADRSSDGKGATASVAFSDGTTSIITVSPAGGTGDEDGGSPVLIMTTDAFSAGGPEAAYTAQRPSEGAEVTGLGEDADAALLGGADALEKAVASYVESAYPTATEAAWDESMLIDYERGTAQLSFSLDDVRESHITLTWDIEGRTAEFGSIR